MLRCDLARAASIVVVLPGREHVEADLYSLQGDGYHRLDPLRFRRRSTRRRIGCHVSDAENPELLSASSPPPWAP